MAINAAGEFEIIAKTVLMKIDRRLGDQPNNSVLVRAKGVMENAVQWAFGAAKIDAARLKSFADVCDGIRENFRNDTELSDTLFDLLDFLEYRVG
jgi:hypothetical protein